MRAGARPGAGRGDIQPLPSREVPVQRGEREHRRDAPPSSIGLDGRTRAEQAAAIEHFFRCRRTGKHKPLADSVLALLADIARRWPGKVIEVVSGYRAPPFGAPHSRHFAGHAIDLRVRGVRTARVRDFVWREHHGVGRGPLRRPATSCTSTRARATRDTAWSAPREDSKPQYDPRWAKRARRGLRTPVTSSLATLGSGRS